MKNRLDRGDGISTPPYLNLIPAKVRIFSNLGGRGVN